jgi:hypothetical protein
VLAACDKTLATYTTTLAATRTAQDCRSDSEDNSSSIYCDLSDTFGLACSAPGGLGVSKDELLELGTKPTAVGFLHSNVPGSGWFPCWRYGSWVTRAYVNFDLTKAIPKIEKVVVANLTWKASTLVTATKPPSHQPPHCFKALFEATDAWKAHATPGNLITDELQDPSHANSFPVTSTVAKWVQSGSPPLGFYFVGTDESTDKQENKRCQTTLDSMELHVTFLGAKNSWWPGH